EPDNPEHLEWLVSRRNKVQTDLFRLHRLAVLRRSELLDDLTNLGIVHLMVGAPFSLWRAVFLGNVSLSMDAIALDAERFLKTLIEDNAINYPQDRSMREWTFGYYVNNAAMRIAEIAHRRVQFAALLAEHNVPVLGWRIVATLEPRVI